MRFPGNATIRAHLRRLRLAAAVALVLGVALAGSGGPTRAASGDPAPLLGAAVLRGPGVLETVGILVVGALVGLAIVQVLAASRIR